MICRGMPVLPVSTRICAGRQDRRFHLPGRSFDATSTSIPFDAEPTLASRRRPESWWVPVEAAGGSPLLQELISRRLFDPGLAARAMTALSGYFCWPDDALARASLRRHPLSPRCSRARDRCRCPRRAVGGHVGDDLRGPASGVARREERWLLTSSERPLGPPDMPCDRVRMLAGARPGRGFPCEDRSVGSGRDRWARWLMCQAQQAKGSVVVVSSYITAKARKGVASAIAGRGLVAEAPIARDEIVAIKGGHIVDAATLDRLPEPLRGSDVQ